MNDSSQIVQEEQYHFPYHYIPSSDNGHFRLFVYWSWGINYLSAIDFLIERLKKENFDSLIDVGCGDGRIVREINNHIKGKSIMGVDISHQAINLAKALNPDLEFRRIDILRDELPTDFDVVTLIEVLEHIPIELISSFVSSIAGLQRPGGRLYITVPHNNKPVQKKHFQHFNSVSLLNYLQPYYDVQEYVFLDKKKWYLRYLRGILKNRFFILNHSRALDLIYQFYKSKLLFCTEADCARFSVVARRKAR